MDKPWDMRRAVFYEDTCKWIVSKIDEVVPLTSDDYWLLEDALECRSYALDSTLSEVHACVARGDVVLAKRSDHEFLKKISFIRSRTC